VVLDGLRLAGGLFHDRRLSRHAMAEPTRGIEIRVADPVEAEAIAALLYASFLSYQQRYTDAAFAATTPAPPHVVARMSEGPVWIAVQDGKMLGTVSAVARGSSLYVRGMAVLPEARGWRIAAQLLRQVEAFASTSGFERLCLSTTPFLAEAIRLYERSGFERSDEGPHDLCGTPLFTMQKAVRPHRRPGDASVSGFLSLAVAQTCPVAGDVDANLQQHVRLANLAADEGARLVAFPELSLTGYEIPLAERLAFSEDDARLDPLLDTAASRSLTLIAGAPVAIGSRLHVGAFILFPDGRVSLYTKHRLGAFTEDARCDGTVPPSESTVFAPGDRDPLVPIAGRTAAVAICADIGQALHPKLAAERGAQVYVASMFVIPSEFGGDAARLRAYAAQYSMVVALANFGSPSGGLAAAGRSSIWSATGELLIQLGSSSAGVAVAIEHPDGWRTATNLLPSAT
jgi:predicted amidohydrolase/GNAT superfamily N-acetyltransferase